MGKLVGDKYGIHRVIEPQGVLTQAALKIDNDMTKKYSNEIICDVISLTWLTLPAAAEISSEYIV